MTTSKTAPTITVEISAKSVVIFLGIIAGVWVLFAIKEVLFILFIAFILASALLVPINRLQEKKVPKWLAIVIVYLSLVVISLGIISLISVPLAKETVNFINSLPELINKIIELINRLLAGIGYSHAAIDASFVEQGVNNWSQSISDNIGNLLTVGAQGASGAISILTDIFGGVITLILIFTTSIYMVADHERWVESLLGMIANEKFKKRVEKLVHDIEINLGRWLVAQLAAATIVGTLCWALLSLLRVQYALPLAIFTGMLNPIPIIGAIISTIPGMIVALAGGNIAQIILVPLAYIFVQQVESQIVTPKLMSHAIGLPPLVIIFALLIGSEIAGFAGMIFAVPVAGITHLAVRFWSDSSK